MRTIDDDISTKLIEEFTLQYKDIVRKLTKAENIDIGIGREPYSSAEVTSMIDALTAGKYHYYYYYCLCAVLCCTALYCTGTLTSDSFQLQAIITKSACS
jgi:hypothetical protein